MCDLGHGLHYKIMCSKQGTPFLREEVQNVYTREGCQWVYYTLVLWQKSKTIATFYKTTLEITHDQVIKN